MKISLQQIRTGFTGGYCYVHARSAMAPDGFTILTAQKLRLTGLLGSHLDFGKAGRGWDFRSPGHGQINFEEIIRELNRIEYDGPLSVEWEDSGMEREFGAKDACGFVRRCDFTPSAIKFDAAMNKTNEKA